MMTRERSVAPENPESLRAQILETLPKYQISPIKPVAPELAYGESYLEFIHECHDLGDRLMRVNGDEVYIEGEGLDFNGQIQGPGLVRIDQVDEWEASSGYTMAMLYDPRWLLTRLKDLQLSNKGSHKELRGNLSPYGMMSREAVAQRLRNQSKGELIEELREADMFIPGEESEKLQRLIEECLTLSEEEVRQRIIQEGTKPWQFLIEVDSRNLPISIRPEVDILKKTLEETGGSVRFQYDKLPK